MRSLFAIVFGCLGCVALSALVAVTLGFGLPLGSEGTTDFVQYWSAWQLLQQGINPYDGALLHATQLGVGQDPGVTIMMWNPPWVPVLLSPLLELPFPAASLTWFVCNLCLLLIIAIFTPRALGYANLPLWVYGAGVCFLPFIDCLKLGQLSFTYTCGFVLFLYFVRLERHLLAGVMVALLMSKPHLFFLFVVPGIIWLVGLRRRDAGVFLLGLILAMVPLVAVTLNLCPKAFTWWFEGMRNPTVGYGVVPVREWKTGTLATLVRTTILSSTGKIPDWPLWVFPLGGLIGVTTYFRVRKLPLIWSNIAPVLLCGCCLLGSYGWLFDQSILVVAHFSLLCRAAVEFDARRRNVAVAGLVMIQVAMVGINVATLSPQHYYVWVPAAYLLLLWVCSQPANLLNTQRKD